MADPLNERLKHLIVETLHLEDIAPAQIEDTAPLIGSGLSLDSIDALELALAISKAYGVQLRSEDKENRRVFASLRALSEYIAQQRIR